MNGKVYHFVPWGSMYIIVDWEPKLNFFSFQPCNGKVFNEITLSRREAEKILNGTDENLKLIENKLFNGARL